MEAALGENQNIISQIQADVFIHRHRALRKKIISKFGRLFHKTSLANLREFYRVATGDQTASLGKRLMQDYMKLLKWRTQT